MNAGRYTFIVDIPPDFEKYVLGGRAPAIQVNVDATAMVQAGLGVRLRAADHHDRDPGFPLAQGRRAFAAGQYRRARDVQSQYRHGMVHERHGHHQQRHHARHHSRGRGDRARTRAWHHGSSFGHAVDAVRDRHVESLGQWLGDHHRRRSVALSRRSHASARAHRRLGAAVHARRRDLSVLHLRYRHIFGYGRAHHAAARFAVHVDLSADEFAFRQQHAARKHAALAGDHDAGFAVDAFRVVRAGNSLPRRRLSTWSGRNLFLSAWSAPCSLRSPFCAFARPRHRPFDVCQNVGSQKG